MNGRENTMKTKISLTCIFLCLYFILLPFDFVRIGEIGSISRIVAILPILFSLIRIGRRVVLKREPIVGWLLLLLMLAMCSYLTSIAKDNSLDAIKTLLLNAVFIIIVGACQTYGDKEKRLLINSLIVGSWMSVIMVYFFGTSKYGRVTLLLGTSQQDQNYLCGFMMFAFLFHVIRFLQTQRIIQLVAAFVIVLAVILTGSRGALIAFVSTIIACIFLTGKEKKIKHHILIISIVGIVLTTIIISRVVMPRLDNRLYMRYTLAYLLEKGTIGRTDIWRYLLNKYWNSSLYRQIFGYGYGTSMIVNDMSGRMGRLVAHNLYIDNLISLGILGLIATVGLHVSCVRTGIKKKNVYLVCLMIGFIIMCFSMSLTSYKPLWSTITMLIVLETKDRIG